MVPATTVRGGAYNAGAAWGAWGYIIAAHDDGLGDRSSTQANDGYACPLYNPGDRWRPQW